MARDTWQHFLCVISKKATAEFTVTKQADMHACFANFKPERNFFCNKKCYTFLWSVKLNLVALPYISLLSITACGTKNINKARSLKQQQLNQIISLTVSLCIQLCYLLACCTHCAVVSISTQIQDKYFRMRNFTYRWNETHGWFTPYIWLNWKYTVGYGPLGIPWTCNNSFLLLWWHISAQLLSYLTSPNIYLTLMQHIERHASVLVFP